MARTPRGGGGGKKHPRKKNLREKETPGKNKNKNGSDNLKIAQSPPALRQGAHLQHAFLRHRGQRRLRRLRLRIDEESGQGLGGVDQKLRGTWDDHPPGWCFLYAGMPRFIARATASSVWEVDQKVLYRMTVGRNTTNFPWVGWKSTNTMGWLAKPPEG